MKQSRLAHEVQLLLLLIIIKKAIYLCSGQSDIVSSVTCDSLFSIQVLILLQK